MFQTTNQNIIRHPWPGKNRWSSTDPINSQGGQGKISLKTDPAAVDQTGKQPPQAPHPGLVKEPSDPKSNSLLITHNFPHWTGWWFQPIQKISVNLDHHQVQGRKFTMFETFETTNQSGWWCITSILKNDGVRQLGRMTSHRWNGK